MQAPVLPAWAHGLLDLLAPRSCPGCDLDLPPGAMGACGACEPLLERLPRERGLDAPFAYGGPLADAIRRLKYAGRTDLAAPLGALFADACGAMNGRVDRVVPVPLHPSRLRARGFNQAALLAAPVARKLGVPLETHALRRVRATDAQAGLDASARADNVRGCFVSRPVRGRILVLDDVRTTGATFADVARALREAGAAEVLVLALAAAE